MACAASLVLASMPDPIENRVLNAMRSAFCSPGRHGAQQSQLSCGLSTLVAQPAGRKDPLPCDFLIFASDTGDSDLGKGGSKRKSEPELFRLVSVGQSRISIIINATIKDARLDCKASGTGKVAVKVITTYIHNVSCCCSLYGDNP